MGVYGDGIIMNRPEQCKHPDKTWLTKDQAVRKADQYQMNWYRCFDHFHIGHPGQPRRNPQVKVEGW